MDAATRFLQLIFGRAEVPPPVPDLFFNGEALTFDGVPLTFIPA